MLVWNLFQTAVLTGTSMVVANAGHRQEGRLPSRDPVPGVGGFGVHFFFFQSIVLVLFMVAFWHRPDLE